MGWWGPRYGVRPFHYGAMRPRFPWGSAFRRGRFGAEDVPQVHESKKASLAVGVTAGVALGVFGAPLWASILVGVGAAAATMKALDRVA